MIKLINVNKYFNRRKANEIHAIDNTSLELPDTGIVTLLGPSGCGKTTLLNVIGGLDKANSGKIFIDDQRITRRTANKVDNIRNTRIGYVFQNFNLIDNMTVHDNVAIALKMVGIRDKKVIKQRVEYCLEAVGIYPFRNKMANALSGGQRQRVAIARAIVKNPRIIIADEPTGNLDSANTIEVMNIIKKISADRLVLLVTHERKIAEFYSSRIIEISDGKVVSDRENDTDGHLDYQLENKIYLKDMPVSKRFESDGMNVDVYSDDERDAKITVVVRGGNLYVNTAGKFNVVDENSNIEMINDHYKAIDSSVYEGNEFEYDKFMPQGFKAKSKSIYTPFNMIGKAFKTISQFKLLKKLLLIGFVFASMFTFLAISNILGIFDVKESDFLTTNQNYITVANPARSTDFIDKIKKMKNCEYAIPGNSQAAFNFPLNDYYQTADVQAKISASVTFADTLSEKSLMLGRLPQRDNEVVLDKMIVDKFFKSDVAKSTGIISAGQFIGRRLSVANLEDYKIVGISKTNSPSVYVAEDRYMHILANAPQGDTTEPIEGGMEGEMIGDEGNEGAEGEVTDDEGRILDYDLAPSPDIKKGKAPKENYEVVMSSIHEDEYEIGKNIDKKVKGRKLKLVGFYKSDGIDDNYYVNYNTIKLNYVSRQKSVSVYSKDTKAMLNELKSNDIAAKINYDRDKNNHAKHMKNVMNAGFIVAVIIIIISLLEMFLMLRSSFLSRIKEIGTLRAIGLKKREIYRMFIGEIIVITTITGIPGIALMYYLMKNVVRMSTYLAGLYILEPYVMLLTFGVSIVFNLIVGLIPVFRTMRKTPAQILSRVDI